MKQGGVTIRRQCSVGSAEAQSAGFWDHLEYVGARRVKMAAKKEIVWRKHNDFLSPWRVEKQVKFNMITHD